MTTINVSSTAALNSALKTAQSGDVILLSGGTYSLTAKGLAFAGGVTIASADSARPAILTQLNVTGSNGLTFQNLELRADAINGVNPFTVAGSQNITFRGLDVHGSLDNNPHNDVNAFLIRESTNVLIEDSEFQQLQHGISHLNSTHVTIRENLFHDMRTDGIRGGGSSWVTITGNSFRDFRPMPTDHADAIQFWTTGTTHDVHDIVITDNLIQRGDGAVLQGVLIGGGAPGVIYERVTIEGNLVSGGMYNGIHVSSTHGAQVRDNIIQGWSDMKSWIRLDDVSGGVVSGNSANVVTLSATVKSVVSSGNTLIAQATDRGAAVYEQWLAAQGGDADGAKGGQYLTGTAGVDTLSGGEAGDTLAGGAGADLLSGGAGDDIYITDGAAKITEAAGAGIDTVRAPTSFTLANNIENLELTGTGTAWGQGNTLGNVITGNAGSNNLFGRAGADTLMGGGGGDVINGGVGDDVLSGGVGVDRFVFIRGDGSDVVKDFGLGGEADVLDLSNFLSAGLRPVLTATTSGVLVSFTSGDDIMLTGVRISDLTATPTGYVF